MSLEWCIYAFVEKVLYLRRVILSARWRALSHDFIKADSPLTQLLKFFSRDSRNRIMSARRHLISPLPLARTLVAAYDFN